MSYRSSRSRRVGKPSHRRAASLSAAVEMALQPLEGRQFFNAAPLPPTITEPLTDGKVVFDSDVHMEIGDFADPDAGDVRLNTDWEIWTTGATPQRVWFALAQTGPFDDHHIHLGDGTFAGPQAGQNKLAPNTDYQLRVRQRDNSGDAATRGQPISSASCVITIDKSSDRKKACSTSSIIRK